MALALLVASPCGAAQVGGVEASSHVQPEVSQGSVRSPAADAAIVRDYSADPGERASAARRLIANQTPEARGLLQELLAPASAHLPMVESDLPDAQLILIRQLGVVAVVPPWLFGSLSEIVTPSLRPSSGDDAAAVVEGEVSPVRRVAVIQAMGGIRTREAAKWLIEQARRAATGGPGVDSPEAAAAAVQALIRLTGHAEFGSNLDRWGVWLSQVQWVSDAEWRRELAESLAARADELARQRDRAMDRLIAGLRKNYFATEGTAERSDMLADFLKDTQPEVRTLGLSLATGELANARRLGPVVGAAAVQLLGDPSPAVRRDAAQLVTILTPAHDAPEANRDGSGTAIVQALRRETDVSVAAILLRAAARWPDSSLVSVAMPWLEAPDNGATVEPACELLDAIRDHRPDVTAPFGERIARVLRTWRTSGAGNGPAVGAPLPACALRLLYVYGDDADRERITRSLKEGDGAARTAVAAALASVPEATDDVLRAAAEDAALFGAAARVVTAYRTSARGFQTLAQLPCEDPDTRREQLLKLSRVLSHADLYRVAVFTADLALRDDMLSRLLTEPISAQYQSPVERTAKPEVVAGLLLLANTRMQLGRPAGALAAVDALTPAFGRGNPQEQDDRRTELLLWLNRIDVAAQLNGSMDAWLRGLGRCVGLPHGRAVLAAFDARFGPDVTGQNAEKLAAYRLAIENGPKPDSPPVDGQR